MLPFYLINKIPPLQKKLYQLYENRAYQIVPHLIPSIIKKDHILDLGCGTAAISREIKKIRGCQITLADVQYNPMCDQFPVIIYDGQKLPFPDNHFSKTLLIAVLHHCKDPLKILGEVARVTSGEIIIMEDVFSDWRGRIITFIGDCLVNWEIHSPFKNHSTQNWVKIFQSKNLIIKRRKQFQLRCIGFPFKLAIFMLSKKRKKIINNVEY